MQVIERVKFAPPIEIPEELLEQLRLPRVPVLPRDKPLVGRRALALLEVQSLLNLNSKNKVENAHASAINYLDHFYPGWRGYEVVYADGRRS